jgi:Rrf2 family protein
MKISSKTDYALRTVLHLAMNREKDVTSVCDIAASQNIPEQFLAQILLTLKSLGIVRSRRGIAGGYQLALEPEAIPLDMVIQATDERFTTSATSQNAGAASKPGVEQQILAEFWSELSNTLVDRMKSTTIRDLCNQIEERKAGRVPNYVI